MSESYESLPVVPIGIIGGSGLEAFSEFEVQHVVPSGTLISEYGEPSSDVKIGRFFESAPTFAFISRHGPSHSLAPSEVPYRANVFALCRLGAERIIGVSAAGSLSPEIEPGTLAFPDQLVDNTKLRQRSFLAGTGLVSHTSMARSFCPVLRQQAMDAADQAGAARSGREEAAFVTIEGPQFSSVAESRDLRERGFHLVGMTTSPEAHLAREAGKCYVSIVPVTDYDVGLDDHPAVDAGMVDRAMKRCLGMVSRTLMCLLTALSGPEPQLARPRSQDCGHCLEHARSGIMQPEHARTERQGNLLADLGLAARS